MLAWIARRLAVMAVSFVGITFVLFALIRWYVGTLPGGDQAFREFFRQYDYLGASIVTEYLTWLGDFLTVGGQSRSLVTGASAQAMVLERVPATLLLMVTALLLQTAIAVPLGVLAAVRVRRTTDHAIAVLVAVSSALPSFLLALLAILVFSVTLHLLPSSGLATIGGPGFDPLDGLRHLALPACVLASLGFGRIVRYVRSGVLEALSSDYVVMARAKGLGPSAVAYRHALPNALLPLVTVLGLQVSVLLGGSFLVEIIFGWPGLGRTAYDALQSTPRDFPVLLAFSAVAAIGVLAGGFLADLAYLIVDPRLRAATLAPVTRTDDATIPRPVLRLAAVALAAIVVASNLGFGSTRSTDAVSVGCFGVVGGAPCAAPALVQPTADPLRLGICTQAGGLKPCAITTVTTSGKPTRTLTPIATPFLPDPAARVTQVMRSLPFGGNAPGGAGCAVAISDRDQMVYAQGFGDADIATHTSITPTTVFEVESVSKQFTAAAILLLAGDGRLALSDDVRTYVPELPDFGPTITIADLMYMRSGLPEMFGLIADEGFATPAQQQAMSDADVLAVIRAIPGLVSAPGSQYEYINTNYILLRFVVERASGESFEAFTQARIFRPLGMTASFFDPHPTVPPPGQAIPYGHLVGGGWTIEEDSVDGWNDGWLLGANHLQTDVLDLLKWEANFDIGIVGGPAFPAAQTRPGGSEKDPASDAAYAAGLVIVDADGHHLIEHAGWATGFAADVLIDPADHLDVAMTCNTSDYYADEISLMVLDAWLGVPTSVQPGQLTTSGPG